jgi:transcriptional regulator with XRE-family HTH domain
MTETSPAILMRRAVPPAWGRALREAMERSKHLKTQTALARRSGVPQSTIGRILRSEVDPQSGSLHRLARALGMPLTELARMAEDSETPAEQVAPSERAPLAPASDTRRPTEEKIDRALLLALARREDRKRGEQALESLRREENGAIEQLQELVRAEHIHIMAR